MQAALAEAQAAAAAQEHRLGESLESIAAALASAAEERDALEAEVGQLEKTLSVVRESSEAKLHKVAAERDEATAQLEEARELLRLAEVVRESQIALESERDRLIVKVERLEAVAKAAQAEAEEQATLLAEEQDRNRGEREMLVARQAELEEELNSTVEQLAVASAAAESRERELQLGSQKLAEALEAVRSATSGLVSSERAPPGLAAAGRAAAGREPAAEDESVAGRRPKGPGRLLAVRPGPNGYELIPRSGVPPQAGDTIELVVAEQEEPARFEVLRSSRTLPAGDICVYLAPV